MASGTASGTITLPDDSTVSVTFEAINEDLSPGMLYGAQVDAATNYWAPETPFISAEVENAPPSTDILQLEGGQNQTYRVILSEPIKDPVMAIVSLGQPSIPTSYDFDAPFEIVSQGTGYWGGTDTSLAAVAGDVLEGSEGHGTIRFIGTFETFSWTVPTPERWHGFTFAIRTTERLEPTPDGEGGAGGMGSGGAGGESSGEGAVGGESSAGAGGGSAGEGPLAGAGGEHAGGEAGNSGADSGEAGRGASGAMGGSRAQAGSGGRAGSGGSPSSDAGSGDDDDGRDDRDDVSASCSCSTPGSSLSSQAPALVLGAFLLGLWRRRVRRR